MKKKMGKIRMAFQLGAGALLVVGGLGNLPVTLLIVLVATVLAGPIFCGWICPFGTLQDIVSKLTKNVKKHKMPRSIQKVLAVSRYILLAVTTLLTADFVFTLMQYDARINFLSLLEGKVLTMGAYGLLALYLVVVVFFERPFCNYMCPQGAKYGLMGVLRPFRIVRDTNKCVKCGKCDKVCPMNIDIMRKNNVKSLQCINCLSCVAACPKQGALKYGIIKLSRKSALAYFLAVAIVLATSTVAMALQFTANQTSLQSAEEQALTALSSTNSDETVSTQVATGTGNLGTQTLEAANNEAKTAAPTPKAPVAAKSTTSTVPVATKTITPAASVVPTQTAVSTAKGEAAGVADGTYQGVADAFRGPMTVAITVKNGQIISVEVVDHSDDRKWFNRAVSMVPDWIIEAQSTDVDSVSGATYSSLGIINAAKNALRNAK